MKKLLIFVLFLPVLVSCNEVIPEGYYNAKIVGEACALIVQVRGGKNAKELDSYDYIEIKNIPQNLRYVGADFYFESYTEAISQAICSGTQVYPPPNITINIDGISTRK